MKQLLLDTHEELLIDLFAGGGGASSGIEAATGRMVDIAINHDRAAVAMHEANHPTTKHLVSDVFEVDPRLVTQGRPVGFLWASPDCTYHSKARGSKPIRSKTKKRRALAWVVTRWAGQVWPRVIMLENVEEFAQWGPLVGPPDALRPCKKRRGQSFRKWAKSLTDLGYVVEWRELKACDYGAPTIRKRLYLIARRDGQPIVWPEPTHGTAPGLKPFRTAAECIDWTIPMLSIFATKEEAKAWAKVRNQKSPLRPLAENTLRRIARGVMRYVLDNPKPFLVTLNHGGEWQRGWSLEDPMRTLTASRDAHAVIAPYLTPRYGERDGQEPRCRSVEEPAPVVVPDGNGANLVSAHLTTFRSGATGRELDEPMSTVTANSHDAGSNPGGGAPIGLVAANLVQYHTEQGPDARATELDRPIPTIDTSNRHGVVASFLSRQNAGFYQGDGESIDDPHGTVCANGSKQAVVSAFLGQHNGGFAEGNSADGHDLEDPLSTVSTKGPHQSVVAAHIQRDFGTSTGHKADQPLGCITTEGGGKAGLVASFMSKFYGTSIGQEVGEPIHTIPTVDRFGFVTVVIQEVTYFIDDIAMRMLQPRELYLAQGFRKSYIIDRGADGKPLTKTEQVRMCGNSVSPPVAEALVRANVPELSVRRRIA